MKSKKPDSKELKMRALLHMAQEHYKKSDAYTKELIKLCKNEDAGWEAVTEEDSYEEFLDRIKRYS